MRTLRFDLPATLLKATLATALVMFVAVHMAIAGSLNLNSSGVAIQGYDPVAYFDENAPVKGQAQYSAQHDGATYWFSSEANRDKFAASPAKYVPAYGGYCAYGVAQGAKVPIDPEAFKVVDGTLYLNINKNVQKTWEKDIPGYIETADKNWKTLGG